MRSENRTFNQATVLEHLKQLHREIEADAGEDADAVTDDVCPLDGLKGFDSLDIPAVIRRLARVLGLPLAKGVRLRNPYVDSSGKTELTLRSVAKRFCALYGGEEEPS